MSDSIRSFLPPTSQINPAKWTYDKLVQQIVEFESELTGDEEIGGRIVGTPGPEGFFHIEDLGYVGPHMIIFYGSNSHGKAVELIQHWTQLSVMLTALPKEGDKPRRIGFELAKTTTED